MENRKWFHRWVTRYIVVERLHGEFAVGARGKNRERNIALVFQPFEHTNTFSPDSFGTPRLPPFYHIRWMYEYCWGLGETCIHIYYIWNDLTVSRKTENSCITLFPRFRYSSAFFYISKKSRLKYSVHTNMQKKSTNNSLVYIDILNTVEWLFLK